MIIGSRSFRFKMISDSRRFGIKIVIDSRNFGLNTANDSRGFSLNNILFNIFGHKIVINNCGHFGFNVVIDSIRFEFKMTKVRPSRCAHDVFLLRICAHPNAYNVSPMLQNDKHL